MPRDRRHELAGGMRQQALIALAMGCRPRPLIADEPTTARDATVQARVLALLAGLRRSHGLALRLVTRAAAAAGLPVPPAPRPGASGPLRRWRAAAGRTSSRRCAAAPCASPAARGHRPRRQPASIRASRTSRAIASRCSAT
jgi:hypothetical protein